MTLAEAITELTKQTGPKYSTPHTPFHDALKLGIAALARIRYQRLKPTVPHKTLLPGETRE